MTTLTNDALLVLAEQLNTQALPTALGSGPKQDSYDEWNAARTVAVTDLRAANIIDPYGDIETDLAQALFILAKPERELLARTYAPKQDTRVCVASRDDRYALAVRAGDVFQIRTLWSDGTAAALSAPIFTALGTCDPADITALRIPTVGLAHALEGAKGTGGYTDALYALGAPEREATILGAAFSSCYAFTEIVARVSTDGVTTRAPGSVAIYDTDRGRITVSPHVSPDRQTWSTITTGSEHRVTQAIAALLDGLPEGRWPTL